MTKSEEDVERVHGEYSSVVARLQVFPSLCTMMNVARQVITMASLITATNQFQLRALLSLPPGFLVSINQYSFLTACMFCM